MNVNDLYFVELLLKDLYLGMQAGKVCNNCNTYNRSISEGKILKPTYQPEIQQYSIFTLVWNAIANMQGMDIWVCLLQD